MPISYSIEVAVPPETTTVERGRLLAKFASRFLETQNYRVTEEVRLTAAEVDLLGIDKTTSEQIFVECKAHRANLSSEVLQKLLGNVHYNNYNAGWLISTSPLSKDAKGFHHEWQRRTPDERRRLHIYPPDLLIERLMLSRLIVPVSTLRFDTERFKAGHEAFLLITPFGEFWALPVVDPSSGIQSATLLFHAETGNTVVEQTTLDLVAKTDTSLTLPWIVGTAQAQRNAATRLKGELESIVRVPMADHWADYRPARPEDFVGRETIQSAVFQFLDAVRTQSTPTRLIAIKSPSGWGKSSSLLKITSRAANTRNRGKYFVYAVDSRAATTRRFPELAIVTAIKEAVGHGFVRSIDTLEFGGATNLFSTPQMQALAEALKREEKVICVFFDQFEELLSKAELVEVFDEMRRLCAAIEEAQANVVVGFSWKTDGVIPTEHNAYHMWHALADRRFEIELNPFTEREVALAITRFAKELGEPIVPQLRRVLQDHCQGFPWLLKKLCLHIFDLSKGGIEQADILNRSINIQSLFKKDLENLSSVETACIKQIASESPAEFFRIAQNYGDNIVSQLIDKRLIIRSGTRLTIYWDIFRDYILTEKIPYIPVTYVPQANFSRYAKALTYLLDRNEATYADLAQQMDLSMGAADNLVRDLVNVGHVEANRKENTIVTLFKNEARAIDIAFDFWRSHEVVRMLQAAKFVGGVFSEPEFISAFGLANKRAELGEKTIHAYALRTLRWLVGIGVVEEVDGGLVLQELPRSNVQSLEAIGQKRLRQSTFFLGEAPPTKVVTAFKAICERPIPRDEVERDYGRNTCYVLFKLGLMRPDGQVVVCARPDDAEDLVAERARQTSTVVAAREFLARHPDAQGLDVGKHIAEHFNMEWSEGSFKRYGSAIRQWAEWSQQGAVGRAASEAGTLFEYADKDT